MLVLVPQRWLTPAEAPVWRSYLDSARLLLQALDRQLQDDAGISFTDYEILVQLSEAPGRRLRMRDLAAATMSTRSGATRAITRLATAGWVRRVECDDDRRGTEAELTRSGLAKLTSAAPGHVAAVRRLMFDVLDQPALDGLGRATGLVRDNLRGD